MDIIEAIYQRKSIRGFKTDSRFKGCINQNP